MSVRASLFAFSLAALALGCRDLDADGTKRSKDCDDLDPSRNPDAVEVCNGLDDDCDGQIDEDVAIVAYLDRDGDGFGDSAFVRRVCELPEDGALQGDDCDDYNASTFPGAPEQCDEADNDCDGSIDEDVLVTFYLDADRDGYGVGDQTLEACFAPMGWAAQQGDCADTNALAYPGASESCNGEDDDCDTVVDNDVVETRRWADLDGDGYGDPNSPLVACGIGNGVADNDLDCDDLNPARGPQALETRGNGVDEDCDGYIDEYGVPDSYATLADALSAAPDGAVVQLGEGTHQLAADLTGRNLTFAGEGCDRTVIDAVGQGQAGITADGGTLDGFTVTNGSGTSAQPGGPNDGGGVLVTGGQVRITEVCMERNYVAGRGGGLAVSAGDVVLSGGRIHENRAEQGGGVFVNAGATLTIRESLVSKNIATVGDGGGFQIAGGTLDIAQSVIAFNQANDDGGGISGAAVASTSPVPWSQPLLRVRQVTLHGNKANPDASIGTGTGISIAGGRLELDHSLLTGQASPGSVLVGYSTPAPSTPSTLVLNELGFDGNLGRDQGSGSDQVWFAPGHRGRVQYVRVDPTLPPSSWDFRLTPSSAMRNASRRPYLIPGQPAPLSGTPEQDAGGSPAQLGAFGGPDAPAAGPLAETQDTDADGMLDVWEIHHGLARYVDDAAFDPDADGLSNLDEISAGSSPTLADTDGDGQSDRDEVQVGRDPASAADGLPVAVLAEDQISRVGQAVTLDASASLDPDHQALTYAWTLTAPAGSALTQVGAPAQALTGFTPDAPGTYTLTVAVRDGHNETTATQRVLVVAPARVPADFPDLQAAINAAPSDGAIELAPGRYIGGVNTQGKRLTIYGDGSAESVVIDAAGRGPVLVAEGGSLSLRQLTLTHGQAVGSGGGIYASGLSSLQLRDVQITESVAQADGGAIFATNTPIDAAGLQLSHNRAQRGGALALTGASPLDLRSADLSYNEAMNDGGALFLSASGGQVVLWRISQSALTHNTSPSGAVAYHDGVFGRLALENDVLAANQGASGLITSMAGRMFLQSSVLLANEVGGPSAPALLQNDRAALYPLGNVAWPAPTRFFDDEDTALAGLADPVVLSAHGATTWLRDDLATDDLWVSDGAALVNRGFADSADLDGSVADAGPGGGPDAPTALRAFRWDSDLDGMSDGAERAYGLDPLVDDAAGDADSDGLSNLAELQLGTRPDLSDSDRDGRSDNVEQLSGDSPADDRDHAPRVSLPTSSSGIAGTESALLSTFAYDIDGGPVTVAWALEYAPESSSLSQVDQATSDPASILPDARGTYRVRLSVTDGDGAVRSDTLDLFAAGTLTIPADAATLADALLLVRDNDTVQLPAGLFDAPGTLPAHRATLRGAGAGTTWLIPPGAGTALSLPSGSAWELAELSISGATGNEGGAIACKESDLTLSNVDLSDNTAYYGGGVYANACDVVIQGGTFQYNSAIQGGALHLRLSTLNWRDTDARHNDAVSSGGAALLYGMSAVSMRGLIFEDNHAASGGALRAETAANTELADLSYLTVVGNSADDGALTFVGQAGTIRDSIIQDNDAYGVYRGQSLSLILSHLVLYENTLGEALPSTLTGASSHLRLDAQFADQASPSTGERDLHLRSESPARGSASELDAQGQPTDRGAYGGPDATAADAWYADTDGDGLPDGWEREFGLNPTLDDAGTDADSDGLSALAELQAGTNPTQADTDGDGQTDGAEVLAGSNPLIDARALPTASIAGGVEQVGAVGGGTSLDGGGSSDPQSLALSYAWTLDATPGRSSLTTASLSGGSSALASLTPDFPGTYTLSLTVSSVSGPSAPAKVSLVVPGDVLVPDDYASIELAYQGVASGSAIAVSAGNWPTNLQLNGKPLTMRGAGRDQTTLYGVTLSPIVLSEAAGAVTLSQLSMHGGRAARGAAISAMSVDVSLTDVTLDANEATIGGAVWIEDGQLSLDRARVIDNLALRAGGAIYLIGAAALDAQQVLFAGNGAVEGQGGVLYADSSDVDLLNVVLADNFAREAAGLYLSSLPNIANPRPQVTLAHVTAMYNGADNYGSVLRVGRADVSVDQGLFMDNGPGYTISLITSLGPTYAQTNTLHGPTSLLKHYENFTGYPLPDATQGNLIADQAMTASDDGDWTNDAWRISGSGPARDAGGGEPDTDGSATDRGAFGGPAGSWIP